MAEMELKGNLIAGVWKQSLSGQKLSNASAIDSDIILHDFPSSNADDALAAIEAAQEAQKDWAAMPAPNRGSILFKAAEILSSRSEEAAVLMVREMGKPIREARGEIARCIDILRYYGNWGWRFGGERFPSVADKSFIETVPVPLGVVSLITPWNFPFAIPLWKTAPALITGNTVVLKPASQAPASVILMAEILQQAQLPGGVLNIVCGRGGNVSGPLLTDERVKAVSFTGSCGVGKSIFEQAATPRRRVGLEMGGNNPLLVMSDADLDFAVELAAAGAMGLAGQKCTATSRVIVLEDAADEFSDRLIARVKDLRTADPMEESTDVGPVIDEDALEGIIEYIEIGKSEGATLAAGGRRLSDGNMAKGAFCEPTVFTDVDPKMKIASEEIFGPVLAVITAADFDNAMEIANDISYGLSAAICTRDMSLAHEFVKRIDAGLVHVNSTTTGAEAHVPFGGMKGSTSGFREMGEGGIDFFSTIKTVYYTS